MNLIVPLACNHAHIPFILLRAFNAHSEGLTDFEIAQYHFINLRKLIFQCNRRDIVFAFLLCCAWITYRTSLLDNRCHKLLEPRLGCIHSLLKQLTQTVVT